MLNVSFFFSFQNEQLFPQIDGVMVKPLREAYEHYENKRIEEEKLRRAREKRRSNEENMSSSRSMSKESGPTEGFTLAQPQHVTDAQYLGSSHEIMDINSKVNEEDITAKEKQVKK